MSASLSRDCEALLAFVRGNVYSKIDVQATAVRSRALCEGLIYLTRTIVPRGHNPEHEPIPCFKLLLYDPHENAKQVQRVFEKLFLANQTLHDLLTATLSFF
jgi:hypothetical protein